MSKSKYYNGNLKIYLNQDVFPIQQISDVHASIWKKGLNTSFTVGATNTAEMNNEKEAGVPTISTNWRTLDELNMSHDEAVAIVKCSFEATLCVGSLALAVYAPPAWAGAIAMCGTALIDCTDMLKKLDQYERRVTNAMRQIKEEAKKTYPEITQTTSTPVEDHPIAAENWSEVLSLDCLRLPATEITSSEGNKWLMEAEVICKNEW